MSAKPTYSDEFTPNYHGAAILREVVDAKEIGRGPNSEAILRAKVSLWPERAKRTVYIKGSKIVEEWQQGYQVASLDTLLFLYGNTDALHLYANILYNVPADREIKLAGYLVERPYLSREICHEVNSLFFLKWLDTAVEIRSKPQPIPVELPISYGATLESSDTLVSNIILTNRDQDACLICESALSQDGWSLSGYCSICENS
jgi:hypothetical protein